MLLIAGLATALPMSPTSPPAFAARLRCRHRRSWPVAFAADVVIVTFAAGVRPDDAVDAA